MWSKRIGNHRYIFHNGVVIFKQWLKGDTNKKTEPSMVIDKKGFDNFKV